MTYATGVPQTGVPSILRAYEIQRTPHQRQHDLLQGFPRVGSWPSSEPLSPERLSAILEAKGDATKRMRMRERCRILWRRRCNG